MRALVTGAHGFVGTHLRAHLAANGDDVVGVDHDDGDITAEGVVDRLVSDAAPEVIYHLAGAADVGASWRAPISTWEVNATATLRLLEAARIYGVQRVLVVSSADVYGLVDEADLPLTETTPPRPASPYAASKLAAEQAARQAWLGHGLETILVRAFNHIGPGQRPSFVVSSIATAIAENELSGGDEIPLGDVSPRRDFTDVRDVARAYRRLMVDGEPGETYCVCSGVDVSIAEVAEALIGMAAHPMRMVTDPDRVRPVDLPALRGSNDKIRQATGWEPTIPLTETLANVLDERREWVQATSATQSIRSTS